MIVPSTVVPASARWPGRTTARTCQYSKLRPFLRQYLDVLAVLFVGDAADGAADDGVDGRSVRAPDVDAEVEVELAASSHQAVLASVAP